MILDNVNQINILPLNPEISSIEGINVISVNKGVAEFDSFQVVKDKEIQTASYTISSKAVDKQKVRNVLGDRFTQPNLVVNFRDCRPGERQLDNKCSE